MLIGLAALLAIAAALPFFVSLDRYIPRIEAQASARLQVPVSIRSMKFAAFPLPHVTIDGIAVGKTDDIQLGKVMVTPDLFSLLRSTTVIRTVEIDSLVVTPKAIERIMALAAPGAVKSPRPSPQLRVESIRVDGAVVRLDGARFGPFDARVRFDGKGEPEDASIAAQDGKFKALVKPGKSGYLIDASAKSWTLPVGPPLVFDELIAKGTATLDDANLGEVSARLYGGTAFGKVTVGWRNGLRLEGNLDVSQLEMEQVASILSPGTRLSGKLTAKPAFSASAASADQLMNALRLEAPFSVESGVLNGVNIEKAATNLIPQGTAGGETQFEQLSGHLVMENGSYLVTQLRIVSGALAADGEVSISAKKELSGRIVARIKSVGAGSNVPLNVGGTISAPLLYPTGGTMAGAVAGTVILGPGLGTTVGAKVGGWAGGLFGEKDEGKKDEGKKDEGKKDENVRKK